MCGPKFFSMEITQQAPGYAAKLNETPEMAAKAGMEEMSEKFREMGNQVYIEAKN
jgi:phosphomethylpyrimidine synthase